jgi:pimeloyl-ACP methyl ester carboxylesterase
LIRNSLNVGGLRLHYAECASVDELVILLHGFPEFWYSWRHLQKEAFAEVSEALLRFPGDGVSATN